MKIISCSLQNFASYKELDFQFSNQGLTLIQGFTGSGKSTLCDAIPWVLFGTTAKGGPVSDVISWPGNEITKGTIQLENMSITRIRGPKAKDNDLIVTIGNEVVRGKDLNDTQKCLNHLLGIDADLYLAGAYFHEFSQTAQFFTTTAKNRRAICEQLVDLSLAKKLKEKLTEKCKSIDEELRQVLRQIATLESNTALLERLQVQENTKKSDWDRSHEKTVQYVLSCYEKFEANRIKTIHNKCSTCGTVLEHPREFHDKSENPHHARLAEINAEINPHTSGAKDFSDDIANKRQDLENLKTLDSRIRLDLMDIELLQDVVGYYRSTSIKNTILDLETTTNKYLEAHFDSEIKVTLLVEDADKVDVTIHKDGNVCSYTQLSKGQRCLLKLCFGVSVMKAVQNHHGINFSQVFFDEALDGLDEKMKVKAYGLLQTISQGYESIFVVEHSSELKAMFTNRYEVELENGESKICQL